MCACERVVESRIREARMDERKKREQISIRAKGLPYCIVSSLPTASELRLDPFLNDDGG